MTMASSSVLVGQLKRKYPLPEPDPNWVQECVNALIEDDQNPSFAAVEEQYLYSDLSQSTLASRVLLPSEAHDKILFPSPVLVQLISLTEIGSSAFQLQTVLEQRRDVLEGATRILRMDEEEEQDHGVEEGKLPAYPRGMLQLEISDGRRVMAAMEYRRINGLVLGETALGAKLVLQNVRVLRGTLLLTPDNTNVLGYQVDHLESEQPTRFVNGLLNRLAKHEEHSQAAHHTPRVTATTTSTAERRAAVMRTTIPTQAESSTAAQARARAIATAAATAVPLNPRRQQSPYSPPPIIRPTAHRIASNSAANNTSKRKRTTPQPQSQSQLQLVPRVQDVQAKSKSRTTDTSEYDISAFELDESMLRDMEQIEKQATITQRRAIVVESDEDDDFGVDESFLRHVDDAVAKATQSQTSEWKRGMISDMDEWDDEKENRREVIEILSD
ncbi:hypothetical protein BCR39DRAFT_511855 [Naematelia encephala]|uniref:RecQ-mediated genome instability protein 1 n=1 Tax=Naematelia encephala TaxID=71784 RepID=A0A1Y2BLZ5_9TREE|nr:hypothetical protein BCR39DRAFT_511855 [Naematelia encephala]